MFWGVNDTFFVVVLLKIFSYINDDIALHSVMNVNRKWAELIEVAVKDSEWETYVKRRWPLFQPHFIVESWRDVHAML